MIQARVQDRKWRVFVVGEHFFEATMNEAHYPGDTTPYQMIYTVAELTDEERQRCLAFMRHYGLGMGVFKFIEPPDGDRLFAGFDYFGEYNRLVEALGYTIHETVAAGLGRIALDHR